MDSSAESGTEFDILEKTDIAETVGSPEHGTLRKGPGRG
jgi:hypothetical protein